MLYNHILHDCLVLVIKLDLHLTLYYHGYCANLRITVHTLNLTSNTITSFAECDLSWSVVISGTYDNYPGYMQGI